MKFGTVTTAFMEFLEDFIIYSYSMLTWKWCLLLIVAKKSGWILQSVGCHITAFACNVAG